MWLWIKRWRDWAMNELWPMSRIGAGPQALHYSFEKAGLTLHDQPIPWNAESVLVEASLRLPPTISRRKTDFSLRLPGHPAILPDNIRRQDADQAPAPGRPLPGDNRHRLTFRLTPPSTTSTVELLYRNRLLGQLTLPFLSRDEFLQNIRVQMPTLFVRIGEDSVACQTFVTNQCRGLLATGLVVSPTSLAPLLDLELSVEFRNERVGVRAGSAVSRVPARLSISQLAGRQAMITVAPGRLPRRQGVWSAVWLLGDRVLASQRIRGITRKQFQRSLRISDTRFVVQEAGGSPHLVRQPPAGGLLERIGPCFLVSSSEAGMAGLCPVQIVAQVPGAVKGPLLFQQDVLITDGPTMVAPGTLDRAELRQVAAFELHVQGKCLGVLSLCPAPAAVFNAEGGFKPPREYTWSNAAEEEMNERLNRLLEG
jgi:hypothetical protein